MSNKYKLSIGDWSCDGHNECEEFIFECNKALEEIQNAYRESCRKTGFQFHADNCSRREEHFGGKALFCEYGEYWINQMELAELVEVFPGAVEFLCDLEEERVIMDCPENLAYMIMDFIKLSLPDLEYKKEVMDVPPINGWWGSMNVGFGYGIFE